MTDIQKKSDILGVVLTVVLWALFTVLCFAVKMTPPHPDYKEIKIQLADVAPVKQSTPVQQAQPVQKETPAVPKEQPAAAKPVEKTPSETKPSTKPAASTAKTTPVKTTPANTTQKQSAPATPQKATSTPSTAVVTKSVEDLMKENNSAQKKQTTWDDSLFDDADDFVESKSTTANTATPAAKSSSSFGGTAAASASTNSTAKSTSSSTSNQSDASASSSTTSALGKIISTSPATYTGGSENGVTSSANISSGSKNDHVAIQMTSGNARELLSPAKPVITISAAHAALIDKTRRVTITFPVLASGTVPLSTIEIKPSSMLPLEIQNEIKAQISTWRFATDTSDGQATFEYSIIKE